MTSFVILSSMLLHMTYCQATPFFTSRSQQLSVVRGDDATFVCAVQDNEQDLPVFWSHGDVILSSNTDVFTSPSATNKYSVSVERADGGLLSVFKLTIYSVDDDQEGEYTCQVPGQQTIIQNNTLVVFVTPSVFFFSPNTSYHDVIENDNVRFECRASGRPEARIVWMRCLRDAVPLVDNAEHDGGNEDYASEQFLGNDNVLLMTSLSRHDSGVYTCKAYNDAGSDTHHVIIDVIYPPKTRDTESLLHVGYGLNTRIVCSFEASQPFEVDWMHNNSKIDTDTRSNINFSQSSNTETGLHHRVLTISHLELQDVGLYTCTVRNKLGEITQHVLLTGIPFNLSIISDNRSEYSDQYTLQWSVHSLSPITSYQLQVVESTTDNTTESNARWMTFNSSYIIMPTSCVVTDLKPNTVYTCHLQVRNTYGIIDPVTTFSFSTAEDGHPAPAVTKTSPSTMTTITVLTKQTTPTTRTTATKAGQTGYRYQQVRLDRNIHNAGSVQIGCQLNVHVLHIVILLNILVNNCLLPLYRPTAVL